MKTKTSRPVGESIVICSGTSEARTLIVLIDNFDSFLYNLARYLRQLGQNVVVRRNDDPDLGRLIAEEAAAVVISPGPCDPKSAGQCLQMVRQFADRLPMLGVCLGHQVIFEAFGGSICRAKNPVHGRSSEIALGDSRLFEQLDSPTHFARYHSLVGDRATLPGCLHVTATSLDDDEIMAVEHVDYPIFGVQFHPESVLSDAGYQILINFLKAAGLNVPVTLPLNDFRPREGTAEQVTETALHYQRAASAAVVLPKLASQND